VNAAWQPQECARVRARVRGVRQLSAGDSAVGQLSQRPA
jgi:hypothetical protein